MTLQFSIGDGILLAQIAWKLARTFTKGRQSAPAQFQEIENELYSLSAALTAAETEKTARLASDQSGSQNSQHEVTQDIFGNITKNCRHTLVHLEEIVQKYMIISEETEPQKPTFARWRHSIVKNWRKIEWTTGKGDLDALRNQIMVHTNSLNLLVSIGTSSRTASIERSLEKKLALLEELHQWYVDNLKDAGPKRSTRSGTSDLAPGEAPQTHSPDIISTFELASKQEGCDKIICSRASIGAEWLDAFLGGASAPISARMFTCHCIDRHNGVMSHQIEVERYGLSHLIFPIRIAGDEVSWVLYKTADRATNQLVDLYIRGIHPSYLHHLEDTFFHSLSMRREAAILAHGAGNSLCYISPESKEEHILAAMSDLSISQKSVESITFKDGRTQLVREWVDDIQLLQYGVRSPRSPVDGALGSPLRWLEYAEILISFDAKEARERGDVVSMVLKLRRNTATNLTTKASLDITSIEAVGTDADEKTTAHTRLDVTIQFITKSAAKEFYDNIEHMRTELFVRSLQYPRSNERIVLNLQTARVECETLYIDDAEITIVRDTDGKYRLIIASRNRCTIISQVLAEDFFTSPRGRPDYTGPTYLVQIGDAGERKIYHYKNGLRYLSLSTAQADRMLELARSSVSFSIRDGERP
ncbi:hypothetical protein F4802DRAFT_618891 [Xylaria palmicola]|nr:hypothetical protein F4802DRAFT_618891 [Xylaria palmicola]